MISGLTTKRSLYSSTFPSRRSMVRFKFRKSEETLLNWSNSVSISLLLHIAFRNEELFADVLYNLRQICRDIPTLFLYQVRRAVRRRARQPPSNLPWDGHCHGRRCWGGRRCSQRDRHVSNLEEVSMSRTEIIWFLAFSVEGSRIRWLCSCLTTEAQQAMVAMQLTIGL